MRLLVLPLILLAATAGAQTARYKITREGKDLGWATVVRTLHEDGTKDIVTTVQVGMARMRTVAKYAADGSTVSRKIDTLGDADRVIAFTMFRFGPKGVEATSDNLGKRNVSHVDLVTGTADPSEYWFVKEKPAPGTKVEAKALNANLKWETRITEYVGPGEGGHLLRQTTNGKLTQVVVDEEGMPIRIDTADGVRMAKIPTKS